MAVIQDPFHGLIEGVLQGHAIATQLKQQAMQEEAFQRAKVRQDQETQLQDLEAQQRIGAAGRPVTGNMVDQSFDAPSMPVPGVPDKTQTISYSRPVDKSRLLTYKTADGRTIQAEAYTPQEQLQRQVDQARAMGQVNLQNAGLTDVFKKNADRHYYETELERRGAAVPEIAVQAGLAQPGERRLPEEMGDLIGQAQKILTPDYKVVGPEGSVVPVPKLSPFSSAVTPSSDGPVNPVAAAAAPGQEARQNFVARAKNAGQPPTALQPSFTAPPKATGDFQKVFLPAFALKHGKTIETLKQDPDLTMQAVQEYAQRSKDPETQRLAHALTQAHLDDMRARSNTKPMPINAGTREYRIAQDLAYGKLTMQQFRSLTAYSRDTNKKMDIYDKASELNPAFNPAAFEMGFKFAANPKTQQQLAALDNVVTAVPDLLKFSDAATRAGAPMLNKYIVPGGIALGGKRYSDFKTAQTAFADELSGALGFGSATDMSREMGFSMTDPNLSPEAFKSAVQDVVVPFIERKRGTMLKQMGVYGAPGMNPAAGGAQPPAAAQSTNPYR